MQVNEYTNTNTGSSVHDSQQTYTYDRFGNRKIDAAGTWSGNPTINGLQTWTDGSSNRLYSPADRNQPDLSQRQVRYDQAGNQTDDYYSLGWQGHRTYDAENRM